jgi:ubiquinone/menaquinone biosynthesis C-methylase UbiE
MTRANVPASEAVLPDRIFEIGYAFWKSKALLSAVELGVFTSLGDGPLDGETLGARVGLNQRSGRDFLDALVALELLDRDAQGRYANRSDSARYLDARKPTYVGGPLEQLNARLYRSWGELTQALRSGLSPTGPLAQGGYATLYADKAAGQTFLRAMTGGSLVPAKKLAVTFPWHDYRTVVDVGTAQGCVPVEIARTHGHLSGGGFDLADVEPAFAGYVREHGLSDRLRFYPGDFLSDDLPTADVLIMGRILHNWELATKKRLLEKAYRALSSGGALILYDTLIDDARRARAHSLLASLNMLIETAGGFEYTDAECASWMQEAGFRKIRFEPLDSIYTAAIGIK